MYSCQELEEEVNVVQLEETTKCQADGRREGERTIVVFSVVL